LPGAGIHETFMRVRLALRRPPIWSGCVPAWTVASLHTRLTTQA